MKHNTERAGIIQLEVKEWAEECFGPKRLDDQHLVTVRFVEEALELAQAAGISQREVTQIAHYVYNRPVGQLRNEVGGVYITLSNVCNAFLIDMEAAARDTLKGCWKRIEQIRSKDAGKPRFKEQ